MITTAQNKEKEERCNIIIIAPLGRGSSPRRSYKVKTEEDRPRDLCVFPTVCGTGSGGAAARAVRRARSANTRQVHASPAGPSKGVRRPRENLCSLDRSEL
ncbi:hypothetical protein MRX96_006545 [Rhipicephalus microplus]